MSLTVFKIHLHKQNTTYTPGELISGEVIVELNKLKSFRGLKLKFKGKAHVKWSERSGRKHRTVYYSAEEEYFNSEIYVLGNTDSRIELTPGRHIFPFTFSLPTNIPNSFEHRLGKIEYTIKAVIDRPWKFDHETETSISVDSPLDLSQYSSISIDDDMRTSYCNPLCPCMGEGSMQADIHIPKNACTNGEALEVMINLNNTSTSVHVTKVKLLLEQVMEFFAHSPSNKTKRKKTILAQAKQPGPFPPSTAVKLGIQIPSVIHSGLPHCGIIDIKYRVIVIIGASGCHYDTRKKYDVLIGSKIMPSPANFFTNAHEPSASSHRPDLPYNPSAPLYAPMPMPSLPGNSNYPMPVPEKTNNFPTPYPTHPSYETSINLPYPPAVGSPYPPAAPTSVGFQAPAPSAPVDTTLQPLPPSYDDVMKTAKQ